MKLQLDRFQRIKKIGLIRDTGYEEHVIHPSGKQKFPILF
jgi:hypothetical protein